MRKEFAYQESPPLLAETAGVPETFMGLVRGVFEQIKSPDGRRAVLSAVLAVSLSGCATVNPHGSSLEDPKRGNFSGGEEAKLLVPVGVSVGAILTGGPMALPGLVMEVARAGQYAKEVRTMLSQLEDLTGGGASGDVEYHAEGRVKYPVAIDSSSGEVIISAMEVRGRYHISFLEEGDPSEAEIRKRVDDQCRLAPECGKESSHPGILLLSPSERKYQEAFLRGAATGYMVIGGRIYKVEKIGDLPIRSSYEVVGGQ